jgi:hypothetical protein
VNLLFLCKPIKLRPPWDVFQKHDPNQRSHRLAYLTSLMAHVQSLKVLLTNCIWSFDFILIGIQLAQLKLDPLAPCCQAWPLCGSHLCYNTNHLCSMTLKRFLKSSMPLLEIWTKSVCLRYNLFVKDHVQLWYMHINLDNWLAIFHGVKQCL